MQRLGDVELEVFQEGTGVFGVRVSADNEAFDTGPFATLYEAAKALDGLVGDLKSGAAKQGGCRYVRKTVVSEADPLEWEARGDQE